MGLTPGEWTVGHSGSVVSNRWGDQLPPTVNELTCYGGKVICESVGSDDDARLIAASKQLLNTCKAVEGLLKMEVAAKGFAACVLMTCTTLLQQAIHRAEPDQPQPEKETR
jgi:hypothetical protein